MLIALQPLFIKASNNSETTNSETALKRKMAANYIMAKYSEQLTYPQKKDRKCLCQFGYGMYLVNIPLFPITDFINPNDLGEHSYGEPAMKEKNGTLYTCRGGFIDFSHLRAAVDWTVYVAFQITTGAAELKLPDEEAALDIKFKNTNVLDLKDIAAMAQKIAFERLVWHEIASWYHHAPNFIMSEQQSTFTPEDVYSNLLGTEIGETIVLRILNKHENKSYEEIATDEIRKALVTLQPLEDRKESMAAYDMVDRNKQLKLDENKRNADIWWDSKMEFIDPRYVFKRNMNVGPVLSPWLVPNAQTIGCSSKTKAQYIRVPAKTGMGKSLYNYYNFSIEPDSSMFYNKKNGEQLHKPFPAFTTNKMPAIMAALNTDMQAVLLQGFDKRDGKDPEKHFGHVRKIIFK
jgi:hypothetical protein